MSSSSKKILLTCFDFPPNEGIGGRRWAKLAKDLVRKGYELHVIKCEAKKEMNHSPWTSDVQHDSIHVYELPRTYPVILSNPRFDFSGKVKYKYYQKKFLRKYKGTIYDNALGWEKIYPAKMEEIIKAQGIRNVIVTGAPFNLFYYTAKLKEKYPDLNIIIDYRDPWIDAANYGMRDLEPKRRLFEQQKQQFVLENADHVVYPSDSFQDEIERTILDPTKVKAKFKTLTHFYDPDDYRSEVPFNPKKNKLKIVYGGSIYMEIERYIAELNDILEKLKKDEPEMYDLLDIRFYTDHSDKLEVLRTHSKICKIQKPIGSRYHDEVRSADFVFILLTEHNKHYRTTKFMETMPFKKPFIYLGPDGDAKAYIQKDRLGYIVESFPDFKKIIDDFKKDELEYNYDFDHQQFSLSAKADEVIELLV